MSAIYITLVKQDDMINAKNKKHITCRSNKRVYLFACYELPTRIEASALIQTSGARYIRFSSM